MTIDRIIRPGVQIQQIFLSTNPALTNPDLPTVIVGVNRQIVSKASAGDFSEPSSPLTVAYPQLEALAVVDLPSVLVSLTNVVLDVFNDGSTVTFAGSKINLTPAAAENFDTQKVAAGDNIVFSQTVTPLGGTPYLVQHNAIVSVVNSATQLTLDRDLSGVSAFSTPTKFAISRTHQDVNMPTTAESSSVIAALNPLEQTIVLDGSSPASVTLTGSNVMLTTLPADGADFVSSGVMVGDLFFVSVNGVPYSGKVLAVNASNSLALDVNLEVDSGATAPVPFLIKRMHAVTFSPFAMVSSTGVSLSAGLQIDSVPLLSAHVNLSYTAIRQRTANVLTAISTANDIQLKLIADYDGTGAAPQPNPLNPASVGAFVAKANTVSSVLFMGVAADDPLSWLTALGYLENEPVYTIVLLTQDPTIQGFLKTHVDGMSLPEKSKFRMGFINLANPITGTPVDPLPASTLTRTAGVVALNQPTADFSSIKADGNTYVLLAARLAPELDPTLLPQLAGYYKVTGVPNLNTLLLDNQKYSNPSPGVFVPSGAIEYMLDGVTPDTSDIAANFLDASFLDVLDRDGQAMAIAQTASSYGDRRITYVTNGEVVLNVRVDSFGNVVDDVLPGYYLAAAYGGMNAGNPPHQGFTNVGVVGIKSVHYGSKYYNETQLGLIAGSGGFVVVQDTDSSLPAAYLQTTTDNSSIQRRELSVTKTLDFYSLGLKKILTRFIGPYNIYAGTMTALKNAVDGWHSFLLGQKYDKIGSPITTASIKTLAVDPNLVDTVRLTTDVGIPIPLNYILTTVEVLS